MMINNQIKRGVESLDLNSLQWEFQRIMRQLG